MPPQNQHHHHLDHHGYNNNNSSQSQQHPPKPSPKILSFILKSIIMALILSLFILFLGVAAIALLYVLLAGTTLHRRRRRRNSSTPNTTNSDLIKHLPAGFSYEGSSRSGKDCAVCLERFKDGERCRSLPDCGHVFHAGCVDTWLVKVPNCPICRAPVRLDPGASASMISDDDCKIWLTALKKVYADVILDTAKEPVARTMVSERRALGLQHELYVAKEEAGERGGSSDVAST